MGRLPASLTLDEAAQQLGLSVDQVWELGQSGAISLGRRGDQWAVVAESVHRYCREHLNPWNQAVMTETEGFVDSLPEDDICFDPLADSASGSDLFDMASDLIERQDIDCETRQIRAEDEPTAWDKASEEDSEIAPPRELEEIIQAGPPAADDAGQDSQSLEFPADGVEWPGEALEGELLDEFCATAAENGMDSEPSVLDVDDEIISAGDVARDRGPIRVRRSPLDDSSDERRMPAARELAAEMQGSGFDFPEIELDVPGASFILQGKQRRKDHSAASTHQPQPAEQAPSRARATAAPTRQPQAPTERPRAAEPKPSPIREIRPNGHKTPVTRPAVRSSQGFETFQVFVETSDMGLDSQSLLDALSAMHFDSPAPAADSAERPARPRASTRSRSETQTKASDETKTKRTKRRRRPTKTAAPPVAEAAAPAVSPEPEAPSVPRSFEDDLIGQLADPESSGMSLLVDKPSNMGLEMAPRRAASGLRNRTRPARPKATTPSSAKATTSNGQPHPQGAIRMRSTAPSNAWTFGNMMGIWFGCLIVGGMVFLAVKLLG